MRPNLSSGTIIRAGERMPLTWEETVAAMRVRNGEREITDDQAATVAWWWRNDDPTFALLASGEPVKHRELSDAIHAAWVRAGSVRGHTPMTALDDRLCLNMLSTWALNGPEEQDACSVDRAEPAGSAHPEA